MGNNLFTTLIEILAVILLVLVVLAIITPYLFAYITPHIPTLITVSIIGGIFIVFLGLYILNGTIAKMSR